MEEVIYDKTVCGDIRVTCTIKDGKYRIDSEVSEGGHTKSRLMPPPDEVCDCYDEIEKLLRERNA